MLRYTRAASLVYLALVIAWVVITYCAGDLFSLGYEYDYDEQGRFAYVTNGAVLCLIGVTTPLSLYIVGYVCYRLWQRTLAEFLLFAMPVMGLLGVLFFAAVWNSKDVFDIMVFCLPAIFFAFAPALDYAFTSLKEIKNHRWKVTDVHVSTGVGVLAIVALLALLSPVIKNIYFPESEPAREAIVNDREVDDEAALWNDTVDAEVDEVVYEQVSTDSIAVAAAIEKAAAAVESAADNN